MLWSFSYTTHTSSLIKNYYFPKDSDPWKHYLRRWFGVRPSPLVLWQPMGYKQIEKWDEKLQIEAITCI